MELIYVSAIFSGLHLLALAIGLPSVVLRGRALRCLRGLREPVDGAGLGRLFAADTLWGIAAFLWVGTGLLRAFGGLEKGSAFYLASPLFWLKMGLLGAILLLEIWPMATFIRWRVQRAHGRQPDTAAASRLYAVNQVQLGLVVAMVFTASLMARGVGYGG
jgi:putative membrane protein